MVIFLLRSSGAGYGAPAPHGIMKYFGLAGTTNQDIHVSAHYCPPLPGMEQKWVKLEQKLITILNRMLTIFRQTGSVICIKIIFSSKYKKS